MAHNYEEFPFPEFKHAIKSGKNTYRNKFFHDIDLSFLLKWMESIEGENYTIRIVGDKLQLIDGEGQVVSEVTLSEGQQGPPGVTPNVSAAAFVDDGTGTPSVEVVKSGTTENPTFSFNFSNLKGETGATGPASTVPGPAGTPFQVKAQYDTYAEMIAAHPTGEVGDAYQVGENSGLATVATTGDYDDLINKPTIPTVNNPTITITQGGVTKGSFTLNQSSNQTIDVDAGGGSSQMNFEIKALCPQFDHAQNIVSMRIDVDYLTSNFVDGAWVDDWGTYKSYSTGWVDYANIDWSEEITSFLATPTDPQATDARLKLITFNYQIKLDDNTRLNSGELIKDKTIIPLLGTTYKSEGEMLKTSRYGASLDYTISQRYLTTLGTNKVLITYAGLYGDILPNCSLYWPAVILQYSLISN